jgi:hypothetical protein
MKIHETSFVQIETGFEHTIRFEFENRLFLAMVTETKDETFIRDCFEVKENLFPIDIPKYFGAFSSDVFSFIYDNIQRGFPIEQDEPQQGETGE